tara:strand:- start:230 stop:493 length:264 start_codon:yes stop_codon:yes gene_type:complete
MSKYILVKGVFRDAKDELVPHGTAVELNENQAKAFSDMFQPAAVYQANLKAQQAALDAVAVIEPEVETTDKPATDKPADKPKAPVAK